MTDWRHEGEAAYPARDVGPRASVTCVGELGIAMPSRHRQGGAR